NQFEWLLPRETSEKPSILPDIDPNYTYLNVLNGTWAPYAVTAIAPTGPAYSGANPNNRKLGNVGNIDVVMTSDKSKWTRVVVLQGQNGGFPAFDLSKKGSTATSVDVNGKPDPNAPSPTG